MSKYVWKPPTKEEIRRAAELRRGDDRMPKMNKSEKKAWNESKAVDLKKNPKADLVGDYKKMEAKQQKKDAQAKTARLGRKGKWKEAQGGKGRAGVAKIAKEMKANGKTGWVTIAGAKINLGGE